MHQPENCDSDNWRDNQHDPRDAIGDRVERLTVEQRGMDVRRQRQEREGEEKDEASAANPREISGQAARRIF